MTTIFTNVFEINGVISTDKTVLQNLNTLSTAAGCWITYDISEGLWSVIINRAGPSEASFDDSNIIGGINVSGTGVNELYNSVSVEFPHKDLRDQTDYIDLSVPEENQYPNELPNNLNIRLDCINNPIQAQYIGNVELKQSRLDKVIEFRTDYSKLGLRAGDIIDVTNDVYGFTNKLFRITKVSENDEETLSISITALEYSADVYDTAGLTRTERTKKTGIVPKAANTALTSNDNNANANSAADGFNNLLTPAAIATLLALGIGPLFEYLKTTSDTAKAGTTAQYPGTTIPTYATAVVEVPDATVLGQYNGFSGAIIPEDTDWVGDPTSSVDVIFTVPSDFTTLLFIVNKPFASFVLFDTTIAFDSFTDVPIITGVTKTQFPELSAPVVTDIETVLLPKVIDNIYVIKEARNVSGYIPTLGTVLYNGQQFLAQTSGIENGTMVFNVSGAPAGEYTLKFQPFGVVGTFGYNSLHSYYNQVGGGGLSGIQVTVLGFKN